MGRNNGIKTLAKLAISVLLIAIITAAVIAGFQIYKGIFNESNYSNWMFYASMAYIALGGFSAYGAYMSTNSFPNKYIGTVMDAGYERRRRIDSELVSSSFGFMIKMISTGILLFIISAAAHNFL